jgi:thioesterase-3
MSDTITIRVRGYHCDFYGHLNHARYLELLEEARWAYLEDRMDLADWKRKDLGIVVASLSINYRRPAPVDTVLEIRSSMGGLEAKTGVINQEMIDRATGKRVADAAVTFAVVDTRTGRAVPLEGPLREVFEPRPPETPETPETGSAGL